MALNDWPLFEFTWVSVLFEKMNWPHEPFRPFSTSTMHPRAKNANHSLQLVPFASMPSTYLFANQGRKRACRNERDGTPFCFIFANSNIWLGVMIPTKATVGGQCKRQSSAETFSPLVQEMQANVSRILGVVHISLDMLEAPGAMVRRPPKKTADKTALRCI